VSWVESAEKWETTRIFTYFWLMLFVDSLTFFLSHSYGQPRTFLVYHNCIWQFDSSQRVLRNTDNSECRDARIKVEVKMVSIRSL
jgi:hypothetical protein